VQLDSGAQIDRGMMRTKFEFSKTVRKMALARAKNSCERCGDKENLTLHHINGRVSGHLTNAMVLCNICHYWKHHQRRRHHK
jgi:hypothetical protein